MAGIIAFGLSFGGCGQVMEKEVITCSGLVSEAGRLICVGESKRLRSRDLGPGKASGSTFVKVGKRGLQAGHGEAALHYVVDSLVAGEHFRILAWRHVSSPGGMIRALSPSVEAPQYEWQLRKSTEHREGDWVYMGLDVKVPPRLAGMSLHVVLQPHEQDSVAYFEEVQVEYLGQGYVPSYRRRSILKDARDGSTYRTVQIGGNWWMAEDLRFGKPKGTYTFAQAQKSVPPGWRLPTDQDWMALEKALGMADQALHATGGRGKNLSFRLLEGGDSGLDFVPTLENRNHAYWTATSATDSTVWARFLPRHTGIGRATAKRSSYLQVRAVLDR
jgi:uncharacterized protein (TIGR02145 family)